MDARRLFDPSNVTLRFAALAIVPTLGFGVAVAPNWRASLVALALDLVILYGGLVLIVAASSAALRQRATSAFRDALTALPNRTLFYDRLVTALRDGTRTGARTGLLVVDLDGFKPVNDSFGHLVGDELLQQMADRMRSCVRETDTVARLGGDEFAVILPGVRDRAALELFCRRLNNVLLLPYELKAGETTVGASIGTAMAPDDAEDAHLLFARADAAMYAQKRLHGESYRRLRGLQLGDTPAPS